MFKNNFYSVWLEIFFNNKFRPSFCSMISNLDRLDKISKLTPLIYIKINKVKKKIRKKSAKTIAEAIKKKSPKSRCTTNFL